MGTRPAAASNLARTCWRQVRQGPAEAGDLGDRAVRERGDDLLGQPAALDRAGGLADRAQLLVHGVSPAADEEHAEAV